ncbi:putative endonuclease [Algoriphagus boseongensis]|uniref:Putative endonuclease n=1 Tax=Algoriphagus boseongensis TaxID=1442587 RepID=A0A4R6TBW4_9BACT|nr:GIY-YIG nuclease family protein [Algoriphagus boseongensis]TDQ19552.1 putative endonuclease [Algoriphagus boseongensis]
MYFTYILTNFSKTVLYIGVTNNLARRLAEHKEDAFNRKKSFCGRYKVFYLLYFEEFQWIQEAISREKELKNWRREKKERLISSQNPNWDFLDI